MYTFDSRVRYSETDENGNLSLESLIDYMQDCTNFQSEDLGVGLEYHRQKNIMWVLNFWQIVIDEYPAMGENITVGTQAFGFEKMFGHRNFLVTHQGEYRNCQFFMGADGSEKGATDDRNAGNWGCIWYT